jgi:hypothetical protein
VNRTVAMRQLRTLAVRQAVGLHVGSDQLIRAGLEALLVDIDSPSLRQLAGLIRAELPDAPALFQRVIEELDLAPTSPELQGEPTAQRWQLVRWWAQLVVDGDLDPILGGTLIWQEGWSKLGYPDVLQPIVAAIVHYEDHATSYAVWSTTRETEALALSAQITDEARRLLDDRWPPETENRDRRTAG